MRRAHLRAAVTGISFALATGCASTQQAPPPAAGPVAACPTTGEAQNVALARAWHDESINRRNPAALRDILDSQVRHHAAGGYPRTMTADGVVAMMSEFPAAFSDLRYTSDLLIAKNDLVVQRYTASGTQDGPFQGRPPSGRRATWTGINIFRIACGRIAEVWSEVDAISRSRQLDGAASPSR